MIYHNHNKVNNTFILLAILLIFIITGQLSTPLMVFADNSSNTFYCADKNSLNKTDLFTDQDIRNICKGLVMLGATPFQGVNVEGIWAGGIDCDKATRAAIIQGILETKLPYDNGQSLSVACQNNDNNQDTFLSAICNICYNPTQANKDALASKTTNIDTSPTREWTQLGQDTYDASLSQGCGAKDCLCEAADLGEQGITAFFSPGRWIRAIIAAIATGIRGILRRVANAFVWAFTGLPKKLGGYVHFAPIYDANTKTGVWYTILGFANLGIVLGMIIMTIATIFRIEKFSWKKMLPKLLLVALLVNFSLVILGIFVDISNYLSMTFLANSAQNPLGDIMADTVTKTSCAFYYTNPGSFVITITAVILGIILGAIFLFQFAGLLFYVASRIITIWICLATSPLAFLGMAIDTDSIKNIVNVWRDRFTQAIVSLPILSFTLYFVLVILNGISNQVSNIYNDTTELGFVMLMAYTAIIIVLAQVLRFVAKSIGVEQIEKGYELAKKAVTGAVIAGTAAIGGLALGRMTTMGARTRVNPQTGETEEIPSYYDRAANAMSHIPVIGSRLSLNLYKIKGKTTGMLAEKINKEVDLIKENENALNAYFDQSINPLARLKAITAKSKAGLTLRNNELDWFMNYGSIAFAGSQDVRDVQKAIPVIREGGHISIENAIRRITPVLQNRESSEKLLGTNIFDYMHTYRPNEFNEFVQNLLRSFGSPRQLENLLLSINFRDQDRIVDLIINAVGGDMRNFLNDPVHGNPHLLAMIDNPPPEESPAVTVLRNRFHL
ncbi:MAG: hypothetical protein GYA31_02530 [Parcubacteria group bacterium]|nr:hypothetical protein [Parcubacteria group bacterium]